MKINTKVVFEWNPESKQYEEVYCESYEYDGEVAECQYPHEEGPQIFLGEPEQQRRTPWGDMGYESWHQMLGLGGGDFLNWALPTPGGVGGRGEVGGQWNKGSLWGGISSLFGGGGQRSGIGQIDRSKLTQFDPSFMYGGKLPVTAGTKGVAGSAAKTGAEGFFGSAAAQGGMMAGGAILGGLTGWRQATGQQKGLAAAIGELDPLKTQAFGAYEKMGGIAESYRPGGTYSRYMGGRVLSQAEEAVGQETSRMIASGITSPSMMRQMGIQSRRQAQASLPGMEMQVSQMALPYEQLASGYFGEYRGLGEQIAGLKGARSAIDPWSSGISGAMSGAMGAATMIGSMASDRRIKEDIKYLHTSNEGHKVYSFK